MTSDTTSTSPTTLPWRCPGWNLSTVEARPEDATDWPDTAVERVTFTVENARIPQGLVLPPDALPLTVYFDESGWPVGTPDVVRTTYADTLCVLREGLHAWPWFAKLLNADDETWRRELRAIDETAFRLERAWEVELLRGLSPVLSEPTYHHPDKEG